MIKRNSIPVVFLMALLLLTGFSTHRGNSGVAKKESVKNIILFIGDGMGVAQLYAGMTVSRQPFYLEKFPYSGLSKTYSADSYITDSGAGGTAICVWN